MGVGGPSIRERLLMVGRAVAAAGLALTALAPLARPVVAASPITIDAHADLGGHVRPGAWAEIDVLISNDGPAVTGELRVRTTTQGSSQFGVAVELASGARQEHWLYAQPPLFATKVSVDLVAGGQTLATSDVSVTSHDAFAPIVGVVAEHPEGFLRDVTDAAAPNPQFGGQATSVITLKPQDLPRRVEAWSAIDRLIWQDVDTTQLSVEQIDALKLWVAAGGDLIILGGSTGTTTLSALPDELLPFRPDRTISLPTADLTSFLGGLPAGAKDTAAIAGTLARGSVMGRSGDSIYAAQAPYGQGEVAIIGLNPAESWLTRSSADTLWRRLLPNSTGPTISPFQLTDDSSLLGALQNLPSVALPPIENLFLLLLAYIVLIGPINYLVLRRLDRREWAWVTMPALVIVFAAGSYAMGAALKGSDVIVNELAIVRAGQGTDHGRAEAYIGVYSPSRKTFDVQVANGALVSNTVSQVQSGQTDQPLDVLLGQTTSQLRNFEVGYGVLRGFRAEAPASAPKIDASLVLKAEHVVGTVTNDSEVTLENVAVVFAGAVAVKPTLAPKETWQVDMAPNSSPEFQFQLSSVIFGDAFPSDPVEQRKQQTRRTVIDVLTQYSAKVGSAPLDVPMLLGWQSTPALDVELPGEQPTRVGDSLYMIPLSVTYDAQAVFNDSLVTKSMIDSKSDQAWFDGSSFNLGRGTMTVELRPDGMSGRFAASALQLALTQGGQTFNLSGGGPEVAPLPDAQQPAQDDPVGAGVDDSGSGIVPPPVPVPIGGNGGVGGGTTEPATPMPASSSAPDSTPGPDATSAPAQVPLPGKPAFFDSLPDLQLFDFTAGRWYEFPHFDMNGGYTIKDAARYVDANGRVLVRLVNRSNSSNTDYFQILARIEGTIQ